MWTFLSTLSRAALGISGSPKEVSPRSSESSCFKVVQPAVVPHACNVNTWEVEAGRSSLAMEQVHGQPGEPVSKISK